MFQRSCHRLPLLWRSDRDEKTTGIRSSPRRSCELRSRREWEGSIHRVSNRRTSTRRLASVHVAHNPVSNRRTSTRRLASVHVAQNPVSNRRTSTRHLASVHVAQDSSPLSQVSTLRWHSSSADSSCVIFPIHSQCSQSASVPQLAGVHSQPVCSIHNQPVCSSAESSSMSHWAMRVINSRSSRANKHLRDA